MNNQIYEICENFDFGSLKLENPTLLNANIYFSKLNNNLKDKSYSSAYLNDYASNLVNIIEHRTAQKPSKFEFNLQENDSSLSLKVEYSYIKKTTMLIDFLQSKQNIPAFVGEGKYKIKPKHLVFVNLGNPGSSSNN